jgi:ABC-type dipeptide/oligopeptide/nickel transport system ATPase component
MGDPKDLYFEFLVSDNLEVDHQHCVVERSRIISITENVSDDFDWPEGTKYRNRCTITYQLTDTEVAHVFSPEKYRSLIGRLYRRPFSSVP